MSFAYLCSERVYSNWNTLNTNTNFDRNGTQLIAIGISVGYMCDQNYQKARAICKIRDKSNKCP